jgi:GSCFA family
MIVMNQPEAWEGRAQIYPWSNWVVRGEPGAEVDGLIENCAGERVYKKFLKVCWRPKWKIGRRAKFFTIGSCFARNVEASLDSLGYKVISGIKEYAGRGQLLNRYTVHSILQEFQWALGKSYDGGAAVEIEGGQWFDYTGFGLFPTQAQALAERRAVIDVMKPVVDADVLVMTLGLVEVWYDRQSGCYLNVAPIEAMRQQPDRYEFRLLQHQDNLEGLRAIADLLFARRPDLKIVVTVSPVPFNLSFSGDDAAVANMYSKSVLRAAAQDWAATDPRIDYFPSYEMVMLSDPAAVWLEDRRHVKREFVRQVVEYFCKTALE